MIKYIETRRSSFTYRVLSAFIAFTFIFTTILPPAYAQSIGLLNLPLPGAMVTPSPAFVPVLLKGMTIHPEDPLKFDFIIDSGNTDFTPDEIKKESERLVKYFLASMTVPKDDLWVNLSPYEQERIIPEELGKTGLGRDMLAQDYILKQLTASLMYPEEELGKKFWDKVYKKAEEQFGTSEIPVNTFNKVWILPETATVYEHHEPRRVHGPEPHVVQGEQTVYIVDAHLKVMLDSDYKAREALSVKSEAEQAARDTKIGSQIIREIIIPEIGKEVNQGQHFAPLRQIYYSLILAKWYKETIKNSLLSQVYVDQNKIAGVDIDDPTLKDRIYAQYMEAYKKGVFNFIKEDYDTLSQEMIPRKYFSGGITGDVKITKSSRPVIESNTPKYKAVVEVTPRKEGVSSPADDATRSERERIVLDEKSDQVSSPITNEEREALIDAAGEKFDLGEVDKSYLAQMWRQAYQRLYEKTGGAKAPLRIMFDRQNPQAGENFILAKDLTREERRQWLGEKRYESLKTAENKDAARNVIVTLNSLDGGIGEKVDRLEYLKELKISKLESEGKIISFVELVTDQTGRKVSYRIGVKGQEETIEVKRGAKGTDLGYTLEVSIDGEPRTVFVSIAEVKLLQIIEIAKGDLFQGLRFQPLVNWQSKVSYEELLEKHYLDDPQRTYRQVLEGLGIGLPEMLEQDDLPWIEKETGEITLNPDNKEMGFRYRQPGGHGQWGYRFLWETFQNDLPEDGATHIRVFYNGDNINSRADEYIAGAMRKNFWTIVKLTTKATPIDRKGGKDGVLVEEINGKKVYIPDQMELADAQAQGQEEDFIQAGQGSDENQPFNTNIFYINTTVLQKILRKLVEKLGQNGEEKLKEIISPIYIEKGVKKGEDGSEYIPIDGAIGTAMHNLNAFFMTDPTGKAVLAEVKREIGREQNVTIDEDFDRLLHFVGIPRTRFFTPVKSNFDLTLQNSDYYTFQIKKGWFLQDAQGKSVPPQVTLLPEKGFWNEQQNHLKAFGDRRNKLGVQGLKSLEIQGKVLLKGARLSGNVKIINYSDKIIDLNSSENRKRNPQFFKNGRLILENVIVIVQADGKIFDLRDKLSMLAKDSSIDLKDFQINKIFQDFMDGKLKFKGEEIDIIKVVNGQEESIGSIDRNIAHAYGLHHRTANVFIITPSGNILLQRRAHNKDRYPLNLSIYGGHVPVAASYRDTIENELKEELGLPLGSKLKGELILIGEEGQFRSPGWDHKNKESRSLYVYLATVDELEQVRNHAEEIERHKREMTQENFQQWLELEQDKHSGLGEVWGIHEFSIEKIGALAESREELKLTDQFQDGPLTTPAPLTADLLKPLLKENTNTILPRLRSFINDRARFVQKHMVKNILRGNVTFAMIKPDGIEYKDRIIKDLEGLGFEVIALPEMRLTEPKARSFYQEHQGEDFYERLIQYVTDGNIVPLFLKYRGDVAAYKHLRDNVESIRARYGADDQKNRLHASDSVLASLRESAVIYGAPEIVLNQFVITEDDVHLRLEDRALKASSYTDLYEAVRVLFGLQGRSGRRGKDGKAIPFFKILEDGKTVDYAVSVDNQEVKLFQAEIPDNVYREKPDLIFLQNVARAGRPGRPGGKQSRVDPESRNMTVLVPDNVKKNSPDEYFMKWEGPSGHTWWMMANPFAIWPMMSGQPYDKQPFHATISRADGRVYQEEMNSLENIQDVFELYAQINQSKSLKGEVPFRMAVNGWYYSKDDDAVKAGASQSQAHVQLLRFSFPIRWAKLNGKSYQNNDVTIYSLDDGKGTGIVLEAHPDHRDQLAQLTHKAISLITAKGHSFNYLVAPGDNNRMRVYIADRIQGTPLPYFSNEWAFAEFGRAVIIDDPRIFYNMTQAQRDEYDELVKTKNQTEAIGWVREQKRAGNLSEVHPDLRRNAIKSLRAITAPQNEIDAIIHEMASFNLEPKKRGTTPNSSAQSSSPVSSNDEVGGIDLNEIAVDRQGAGVDIQFDPVVIQEIIDRGIDGVPLSEVEGFAPVIINLVPLPSVLPLLGLEPKKREEEFEMSSLN